MIDKQKIVDIYIDYDIEYWLDGKNVTQGWVNIQCPFCDDHSNHCGVNPVTEIYTCWKCGAKGHFIDLLIKLTGLSYTICKEMVVDSVTSFKVRPLDRITNILQGEFEESEKVKKEVHCVLPERFELITKDIWSPLLESYEKRRNILRSTLIDAGCGICRSGEYMNRMVIPVVCVGRLVAYQAADMTGFADLKYRSSPLSMGNINDYLYNYDDVKSKRMIVTEGVLDCWRVGSEAVAAFTSSLSKEQKKLILDKELDELYFCFDPELRAYYKARKVAEEFGAYIPKVGVVRLPTKIQTSQYHNEDPNDVGREKIYQLIAELAL